MSTTLGNIVSTSADFVASKQPFATDFYGSPLRASVTGSFAAMYRA